jgi:ADP-ribosylglycohydrolase
MNATSAALNGTGSGMNGNGNGGVTRLYTCKAKVHDELLDVKMQVSKLPASPTT